VYAGPMGLSTGENLDTPILRMISDTQVYDAGNICINISDERLFNTLIIQGAHVNC
jgi:hypothetical protein